MKRRFNYDDSLDVFGVHGVGGMTGILLAGVFATASIGGTSGLIEGNPHLLLIQLYGVAVTLVWSAGVTYRAAQAGRRLRADAGFPAAGAGRPRYFATWRSVAVSSLLEYRFPALLDGHNYAGSLVMPTFMGRSC